jgi:predicted negative regulator of RcsB-dependent stress response
MESDVTQSAAFYKAWAWAETHKKHLLIGAVGILVAGLVAGFYVWQEEQKQITASEALSKVAVQTSTAGQPAAAEAYQKVAVDFAGTRAAERALLLAGARFFAEGKYSESEAQFQRFLSEYRASEFSGQAALGVAASLEAQGKTEEAIKAYRDISERRSNESVMSQAKLSLGRLYEAQGSLAQARDTYEQLARSDFSAIGQQAGMHLQSLLSRNPELSEPVSVPTNAPVINLN